MPAPTTTEPGPARRRKNQGKTIRCTVITSVGASVDHPLPVQRELMEAREGS